MMMMMIDSSTSMHNIVPDAPYDPNTPYFTCPSTITLASGGTVGLWVTGTGTPYMEYESSYYDWGTVSGTGPTSKPIRCFDPAESYFARLYADDSDDP